MEVLNFGIDISTHGLIISGFFIGFGVWAIGRLCHYVTSIMGNKVHRIDF